MKGEEELASRSNLRASVSILSTPEDKTGRKPSTGVDMTHNPWPDRRPSCCRRSSDPDYTGPDTVQSEIILGRPLPQSMHGLGPFQKSAEESTSLYLKEELRKSQIENRRLSTTKLLSWHFPPQRTASAFTLRLQKKSKLTHRVAPPASLSSDSTQTYHYSTSWITDNKGIARSGNLSLCAAFASTDLGGRRSGNSR